MSPARPSDWVCIRWAKELISKRGKVTSVQKTPEHRVDMVQIEIRFQEVVEAAVRL